MFLFEDENGWPIPRIEKDPDGGADRVADGVRFYDLEQAVLHFNQPPEVLRRIYVSTLGDLVREPAKGKPAVISPLSDREALTLLWQKQYSHLTESDFQLVLKNCEQRGLSLWSGHVWIEKRRNPKRPMKEELLILTTIGGLRSLAAKTGQLAGRDRPVIEFGDGPLPITAVVRVYRMVEGVRCGFDGDATWAEYSPLEMNGAAKQMPQMWLGKCAEAVALRAAFPEVLSGIYERCEIRPQTDKQPPPANDGSSNPDPSPDEPSGPQTPMEFERELWEMGFSQPDKRAAVIREFKALTGNMATADPAGFYRFVLAAVRKNPVRYGVV